jgi:hypothetical protein
MAAELMTADAVREYQLHRRGQGAEAAIVNRETSALSRMFQLAIRRGLLERMPLFPNRLQENPPRQGFFEHAEYLKVRRHLPAAFQDVLDFAYYSGWRRNEITHLEWDEILSSPVAGATLSPPNAPPDATKRRGMAFLPLLLRHASAGAQCLSERWNLSGRMSADEPPECRIG